MSKERLEQSCILDAIALITAGAVIGIIITLVLALMLAFLVSSGNIPENAMGAAAVILCAFGALTAGFISARSVGKRALITGLVTGAVYFLVLVILGALFLGGLLPQKGVIPILLGSIIGSALGSAAGAVLKH